MDLVLKSYSVYLEEAWRAVRTQCDTPRAQAMVIVDLDGLSSAFLW